MNLNDLVSFIRFSLNDSPYIKTSGPINRVFQQMHIVDRSTESFHATQILLIPQTSNFAVSLTLIKALKNARAAFVKGANEKNEFFEKINKQ